MSDAGDAMKLRRTWPQRLLIVLNSLVVLACFTAAAGLVYVDHKTSQIQRINLGHVLTSGSSGSSASGPLNILLVGVDNAEGLAKDDPIRVEREEEGVTGLRSDTIMVLRLEPDTAKASLLSFPRDLWVTIGDSSRHDKINAAMSLGGPETLIRTIRNNFDIPIDHYVQVDFAQFKRLVDVIDGVKVYFEYPARDENTGLRIREPGCVTLDGAQALAYARSRYYEYYENGRWRPDGSSDLGRISRQQDFIKRALRKAVAKGLRNPFTLDRLINTGLAAVTVDGGFGAGDMLSLANRFRSFDPDNLDTVELPVFNDFVGDASIVRLIDSQAEPVLDRFRGRSAASLTPPDVAVRVLNGTGAPGQGRRVGDALGDAEFDVVAVGDAASADHARSMIRYAPAQEGEALLLARWVDAVPALQVAPELAGGAIELVTGRDLVGVRPSPLAPDAVATTTAVPTTTAAPSGTGAVTTAPSDSGTSSTTRYGVVPQGSAAEQCR